MKCTPLMFAAVCMGCLVALFATAAEAKEGSPDRDDNNEGTGGAGAEGKLSMSPEDMNAMPLWPRFGIKPLLAGEVVVDAPGAPEEAGAAAATPGPSNASSNSSSEDTTRGPVPNVDLFFILQSASASFEPNEQDGGLVGGQLVLTGVQETVVSFADRPYRTYDAIPLAEFFAYPLVQDFFAGPTPPNAIIAGELPSDIAISRLETTKSKVLPYRRLLGGVLGKAHYDPKDPTVLKFDLPAGADIFQGDGEVRILDQAVFEEYAKANNASPSNNTSMKTLQQVSIFID